MKATKRMLKYAEENFGEMLHTTLNPDGPGVVRIHMIPPKIMNDRIAASVAIINGQDVIPVNTSWSILLAEFIKEVNKFSGKEIEEDEYQGILNRTCTNVRKVYPLVPKRVLRKDIFRMLTAFTQIARGEEVDETIPYMTLGEYAPYMQAPHRMDLMVSAMTKNGEWHCNQKCIHCYAAGQDLSGEKELSTSEWKSIIDKCRKAFIPQITFTGGEPTMRDDLVELVEYSKWFVTRLNTNGIKLTKELAGKLMDASLDSVQITFYSNDAAIHNKLVGAAQYDNTVAGIKNALAAGLSVSVNTPLCTLNRDYVETLKFLHDLGVIYVTCSGLITTGNALTETSESLQLKKDEIREIVRAAVEYCYANDMEISFTSPGWIENEFFEEMGINTPSCGAGLSNMAVTPGGNVVPCQSWLKGEPLGNILKDKWEDIWNSRGCQERRNYSALSLGQCPLRKL